VRKQNVKNNISASVRRLLEASMLLRCGRQKCVDRHNFSRKKLLKIHLKVREWVEMITLRYILQRRVVSREADGIDSGSFTDFWISGVKLLGSTVMLLRWGETVFVGLQPLTGPLYIPQMIHEWIWSSGVTILTRENEGLGEKPVPVPLFPPQVQHGLPWARTGTFTERSQRPGACDISRPFYYHSDSLSPQQINKL
jgi:hypothetical protein